MVTCQMDAPLQVLHIVVNTVKIIEQINANQLIANVLTVLEVESLDSHPAYFYNCPFLLKYLKDGQKGDSLNYSSTITKEGT